MALKKILVAVRDPGAIARVTLGKTAQIARAAGASVEVFHALNEPLATPEVRQQSRRAPTMEERMQASAERAITRLQRAIDAAQMRGVKVRANAEWDYPPHEAIIRRAVAIGADLVIAETRTRRLAARLLLANTDWELIRHCPAPLLLMKSTRRYYRPAVIAAVDPFHANAKPAGLDTLLIERAAEVAKALRGSLHLFHAYLPISAVAPFASAPPVPLGVSPKVVELDIKRLESAITRLASSAHIPRSRCHLRVGDVASQLEATVSETGAAIVVMGAVSRSGLERLFIGSTAERLLDRLRCDVLVVKPRNFRSRVPDLRAPAGRRN